MGVIPIVRPLRAGLLGVSLLALLAGCEAGQMGFGGTPPVGEFAVLSASPERAVLSAQGQRVAVEPISVFCVAEYSIETSDRSAFVLIGDCALSSGGADLSSGIPGITTVSISGDPGFGSRGASAADLSALERYLATPEGRALLGRGGDGGEVSIVETRREGNTLFVLVEDRTEQAVPLLATRFWRGFVELNGRLAVVTVSGFLDAPMDERQMFDHLGAQVKRLQLANAAPIEAPVQVAAAGPEKASSTPASPVSPTRTERADIPATPATPPVRPLSRAADDKPAVPIIADSGQGESARVAWGSIPGWPPDDRTAEHDVAEDRPAELAAIPAPATSRTSSSVEPIRSEPVIERSDGDRTETAGTAISPPSNQPMPMARPGQGAAIAAGETGSGASPAPKPAPRLSDSARDAIGSALAGSSAPLPPKRGQR